MDDIDLIIEFNSKIYEIYEKESLIPLSGLDDSYIINGKQLLSWYYDVTNNCSRKFNNHFNYSNNIDDLLFCSDEIIYFTAHLFLYLPYINTPLNDSFNVDNITIYPIHTNLAGKRFDMFVSVCFEKVYSYWDRIGDLIASFFPDKFKGYVYFPKTINVLEEEYKHNLDYTWLKNFVDNEYADFNQQRIDVVHYISKNTQQKYNQLQQITDYEKSKVLTNKIISYPNYFRNMNELCKIGFEKTLNFLEIINQAEN